ncbi:hypothetical protein ES288_A03G071900v1 [Gossypium darwinii]|uniref:EF-hand domain-containing protein n=1 Tax=Gossypium darwinii TaxID=34276 RepID=A0A5D2H1W9_GOSDA|nr:hypothetical protein ES288_A03G071900v1 [Gossypium darwinii]
MMRSEEYDRVVRYFDKDGDGKISASELSHRLGQMGGKLLLNIAEVAVEALDSNGDELLDLEDLIKLMEEDDEEEKLKDLRQAFGMYDEDGCGFITPKGLKKMLKKLGESKSIDECMVMIKHFDINGDGVLSFEEFRVMMK